MPERATSQIGSSESPASQLAQFFPGAIAMRIPVRLKIADTAAPWEDAVIEFGTAHEVLFTSRLPLEFSDRLLLNNSDGSLLAEATVVAVQYQKGTTAVAARFGCAPLQWIVKP
jgi:hypothetical protein